MKKFNLSWNEIWPIANILNEVCHGIDIDIQSEIGFSYEEVYKLLTKLHYYKDEKHQPNKKNVIEFHDDEILILKRSLQVAAEEISRHFQTRVGVTLEELIDNPIFHNEIDLRTLANKQSTKNEKFEHYLQDLISFIKEEAKEAKLNKTKTPSDFNKGHLMAYYEVISLMKEQAIVFDIDQEELGLSDIKPESDLL
ncbi:MAG: hypothetical protein P0S96_05355 [Simkaniaceae bacterium]|nr:hypothetical protein [Candidatus Sacchlamyda saccharinae]